MGIVAFFFQTFTNSVISVLYNFSRFAPGFLAHYGYTALFILMVLESASLPIPSEILLPTVGLLVARGYFTFGTSLGIALIAGLIGMFIDYMIAYYVGRGVVYKNAHRFHITEKNLRDFEAWFAEEGNFTVFIARLIPVVRGLISFPAGFAEMRLDKFFFFSFVGSLLWDSVLMLFGYYALSANSAATILTSTGIFLLILFIIYTAFIRRIRKSGERRRNKE